jgi:midasin (ATPase involved in ribosome maturation)
VSESNSKFDLSMLVPKASPFKYEYRTHVDGAIDFWAGKQNVFTALIGEGSVGKTEAVREFARRNNLPFLLVPCEDNGVGLRQLLGTPGADNGTVNESTWQEGLLSIVIKKPCVILFDEVNCLPASKLFMLHELRDSRKLFVHGAPPQYSVIHAHPEARILCALNPSGNKYSGTNRLNVALASGMAVIDVPDFDHESIKLNCPHENLVKKFYGEARTAIKSQGLRVIIGRRHLERIGKALNNGATLRQAVCEGFINSAFLTTSAEERQGLYNLAVAVFGLEALEK